MLGRLLILSSVICVSLGVIASSTEAVAQQQPATPIAPHPSLIGEQDEAKTNKQPGRVLTNDALAEMLENMGYDFKTETLPNGYLIYSLTIPSDNWKFFIELSIPKSGSLIWLVAPLQTLPPESSNVTEQLVRLLQENWTIHPHSFAIPKDSRKLFLQRALENQNITPSKLRGAIESMMATIRSTAPIWDVGKWTQGSAPSGKADSTSGSSSAVPDTPEGLTRVCVELLNLAKAGKRTELQTKVRGFIVPNHASWFKRIFGAELGSTLSEEYTAGLDQIEAALTRMIITAAEEGQSKVTVLKFTQPDPENATGNQNKALEAMIVKAPLYSVYFTQPDQETGIHLYSFAYIDGSFRFIGKLKAITLRKSGFLPLSGPLFPQLPITNQPEINRITPSFSSSQFYHSLHLGVRTPGAGGQQGTNMLDPDNFRHLAPLFQTQNQPGYTKNLLGAQRSPRQKQPPETNEESIVGTWVGELMLANQRWKVTATFRSNGTYRTVMEYGSYIMADRGTYKYSDGILTTEPEGGIIVTFTVTFLDEDTIKLKGGGLSITLKRQ